MTNEINQPFLISTQPEMLEVEGRPFKMGSKKSEREQPIHEVEVPTFYLSRRLQGILAFE